MNYTWGVHLDYREGRAIAWECVAISEKVENVRAHVAAYQQDVQTKGYRIMVDRVPNQKVGIPDPTPDECAYCARSHWGRCVTDRFGIPVPVEEHRDGFCDNCGARLVGPVGQRICPEHCLEAAA